MDRTQLLAQFLRRTPLPGETVFLWRNGDQYHWKCDVEQREGHCPFPAPGSRCPTPGCSTSGGGWPTGG